ncbi:nuclear transport factor 2 family protein [Microbacterium sp. NPDC055683]
MADTQIPEPVASFVAAVNRHDEEHFLAAFSDDGAVDDWGRVFGGASQIKEWSDREFIGAKGTLAVESVEVTPTGEIVVTGDWRSNYANGRSRFSFIVDGAQIVRMTIREG